MVSGNVVVFDDDHFYMGSLLAEKLARDGCQVTLVTPASDIATYSKFTLEFSHVMARLVALGIEVVVSHNLDKIDDAGVHTSHLWTGNNRLFADSSLIMVTMKEPSTDLYDDLMTRHKEVCDAGILTVEKIGDCVAPGPIAMAVHDGHRWALNFDQR